MAGPRPGQLSTSGARDDQYVRQDGGEAARTDPAIRRVRAADLAWLTLGLWAWGSPRSAANQAVGPSKWMWLTDGWLGIRWPGPQRGNTPVMMRLLLRRHAGKSIAPCSQGTRAF